VAGEEGEKDAVGVTSLKNKIAAYTVEKKKKKSACAGGWEGPGKKKRGNSENGGGFPGEDKGRIKLKEDWTSGLTGRREEQRRGAEARGRSATEWQELKGENMKESKGGKSLQDKKVKPPI